MTPPTATVPGWVAPAILVVLLFVLILVVIELFKSSRVRCTVRERLAAIWHVLRNVRGDKGKRESSSQETQTGQKRSPLSDFPSRAVAVMLLGVLMTFIALYSVTLFRASATFGVNASFNSSSSAVIESNTAMPNVGVELSIDGTVNPSSDQLPGEAVVITGPSTIVLSDCYSYTASKKVDGYAHGAQARIGLAELNSADEVDVHCTLSVKHRIRHLETVTLELMTARTSTTESGTLNLVPPAKELGQEKAEALAEQEVRTSPAAWQQSSMRSAPDAFREQGEQWPRLDHRSLHGFFSEPSGLTSTLHHLEDTRVQSSMIITLEAVITSRPVTQERFKAEGSGRRAIRQVYAIGQNSGEQGGWCTTTRSTAQRLLKEGDHLKLRASVVEWGRSQESGGIAVMLNCPAVKVVGSFGKPARASGLGAAAVPDRFNH